MSMNIIFLKDSPNGPKRGTIQSVSDAYARNFLIPRGLAKPASAADVKNAAAAATKKIANEQAQSAAAAAARERLRGVTVRLTGDANPQGTLFAAVKSPTVIAALTGQYHCDLTDVRVMPDHFKTVGTHPAELIWPGQHKTPLTVIIESEKR